MASRSVYCNRSLGDLVGRLELLEFEQACASVPDKLQMWHADCNSVLQLATIICPAKYLATVLAQSGAFEGIQTLCRTAFMLCSGTETGPRSTTSERVRPQLEKLQFPSLPSFKSNQAFCIFYHICSLDY
jgi:hypothetical protein